ncbi:MAG: hypothetical protein LBQ94_09000 [Treponema sp.]|jgi:hypothetical protein|nr:hypothetical protein [Treponema sp.]
MNEKSINLEALSTRAGFNSAVRHISKTLEISESLGSNNLGDMLYESGDENLRHALLLRMLLIDKLGYKAVSANLVNVAADVPGLGRVFEKWKAVDLVAAYHHPDMGLLIANPKAPEELARFGTLRKRELLVLYAGKGTSPADEICQKAAELALALFEGRKVRVPPELLKGNFTAGKPRLAAQGKAAGGKAENPATQSKTQSKTATRSKKAKTPVAEKAESPAPAPSANPSRMTPMYSVAVTNECFHNGNVEAWKRIIESYNTKYPDLRVYIYYEGERIIDINTLFKWGKVKHGSSIQFAVAGDNIKDVSKLQRYLAHGASPRFEDFLFASPGMVLNLFG